MTIAKKRIRSAAVMCTMLVAMSGCEIRPQEILQGALVTGFNKFLETVGMQVAENFKGDDGGPDMVEVSGSVTVN